MTTSPITRLNTALEGRYRIESELGEGGMATVYLADDLKHERKVALKVLKPELAAVVGAERFLAEIKTTANLQHPHILPLFDSGEADSFLFYVMPYVEGESLRERLERDRQLPVEEAVRIAADVAEALHSAHEQGVIHRDIKPANILLSKGRPLVADFGIALAVSAAGQGRLTETGLSMGTPYYMSPEQASADREPTAASDVYSLGCVLYEMLVGDPPHVAGSAQAVLAKILTDDAPAPNKARASIPANVDAAIRKALERLPADRFASAQDFVRALDDPGFMHGQEAFAHEAISVGRWKTAALTLGAAAVATTLALAWSLRSAEVAQPIVRSEIRLPEGLEPNSTNGVNLAVSPDGSRLVMLASAPGGGTPQLWLRRLDDLAYTPIPGTEEGRNPRFSPDGESIAFTANGALVTVSLDGGLPQTLVANSVASGQGGLAWGPDGMLYFRKEGLGLSHVPATGGTEEEVTALAPGESGHEWPEALPNGKGILYTRDIGGPGDDEIGVLSLETGQMRTLAQGAMARYANSGHLVYTSGSGTLLAARFDQDGMVMTGPSIPLIEGVQVNFGSASQLALSETGVLVYRPGAGAEMGIPVWVDRSGAVEVLDPTLSGNFSDPVISPDERRIAFKHVPVGGTEDIWLYDLVQRTFERFTFVGQNSSPTWSRDGSEVSFVSNRDGFGDVYSKPADLSAEARLLVTAPAAPGIELVERSIDGRVVYSFEKDSDFDLFHAAPHPDSAPRAYFESPFSESHPSVSPDGRWLAYESDESGRPEVYARAFPDPGGRSIVSVGGGSDPLWADNGQEIYYLDGSGDLTVANVRTEPDFSVVSQDDVIPFDGTYQNVSRRIYDVSADGQRILAVRGEGLRDNRFQYILVQSFFGELTARVSN